MSFKRTVLPIGRYIHLERDLGVVRRDIAGDAQGYCLSDHPLSEHDVILNVCLLYRPSESMVCSDDHLYPVLKDPCHLGFSPFALSVVSMAALVQASPRDPHLDSVSVDSTARAALGYEQVSLESFNGYESETSGIAVELACKYLFSLVLPHHLLYVFFSSSFFCYLLYCHGGNVLVCAWF